MTIPAEVRQLLGLRSKCNVVFRVEDGQVRLAAPDFSLETACGSVPPLRKPKGWRKISRIAHEEMALETLLETRGE